MNIFHTGQSLPQGIKALLPPPPPSFKEKRGDGVDDILKKVVSSAKVVDYFLEANRELTKRIEKEKDLDIRISLMNKLVKPEIEAVAMTASKHLKNCFDQLGYGIISNAGEIYVYTGCCWRVVGTEEMRHFVTKYLIKTGVARAKAENVTLIRKYVDQITYSLYQRIPKASSNKTAKINAANCTVSVDLHGNITESEHSKDDFMFYVLPYNFDLKAKAPKFQSFLDEVIPGDIQNVVQEFFGCCLIPSIKLEKVLCCVGAGANGKSVLFEVITYVLGPENVTTYNINSLCEDRSTTRYALEHKLLNYSSDFSGAIWNNGFFKQLASGEPIEARRLYQDSIIMENYARLAYNSNQMPNSSDTSGGFMRRLLIVQFTKTIPPERRDPHLAVKLKAEAPGILNWLIEGLVRYIKNGFRFSRSKVEENTMSQYISSADPLSMFLETKCLRPSRNTKQLNEVYREYLSFCKEQNLKHLKLSDFIASLREKGFTVSKQSSHSALEVGIGPAATPNDFPFDTGGESPNNSHLGVMTAIPDFLKD